MKIIFPFAMAFVAMLSSPAWAANDMTLSINTTAGVSSSTVGNTTTFTATGSGANLNWQDVENTLASADNVAIVASGSITDTTGVQLGAPIGANLTLSFSAGTDISLRVVTMQGTNETIQVNATGTVSPGFLSEGLVASPTLLSALKISGGTLNLNSNLYADTVTLQSTGSTTGLGVIQATTLTGSSIGATALSGANVVTTLGGFTTGGDFSFTNAQALSVNGALSATGNLTVTMTGASSDLVLAANATATNTLTLVAEGTITQTASVITANLLTGSSGSSVTLNDVNLIGSLGSFSATGFHLNDSIALSLGNPFTLNFSSPPSPNSTYTLINASSISGSFSPFAATGLSAGEGTIVTYPGGNSAVVTIAGPATHFVVSAPASATAGTAFNFTVTAYDQFNNIATGYTGTAHFMSSDGTAALPANATLTNGVGTFSATLNTAGTQTITTTDAVSSSITGTSGNITVGAAAATHYSVSAPANATAGTAFNFTVTALDQFGNTATGYTGTAYFTSSDGAATLPANATLTNGVGTFPATLKTAGTQTITTTDAVSSSITGTSGNITVGAAAATHYSVSAPTSATVGTAFSFTVTALDPFNNTAIGYAGIAHFTSSDVAALLPANATLTNGVGTFSATLNSAGNQTITATDTTTSSITGASGTIVVSKASQTITFGAQTPSSQTYSASGTFAINPLATSATPNSGNPIAYSSLTTSVCTISGTTVTIVTAGPCTIAADQAGNGNYNAATEVTQNITINPDATTLTLTATPTPSVINTPVTITATVTGDPPTGTVTFCDGAATINATCTGGTVLCSAVTLTPGTTSSTATCNYSFTALGTHTLSAFYAGDGDFSATATTQVLVQSVGPVPVPAPMLGRWMLLLLGGLMGLIALSRVTRERG